jgi:CO/xanthine dehydrogenase Mo-binding subunit
MPGPRISEQYKYMTIPQAAKRLGIHPAKLRRRLRDGVFPPPTFINEYGLNFFDEDWLEEARTILANSFEGHERRQQEG